MSGATLDEARRAASEGDAEEAVALARAVGRGTAAPQVRFDAGLFEIACLDGLLDRPAEALEACARTDELARVERLPRRGEVDLARSLAWAALDRPAQARVAAERAGRAFRARGSAYLRAHAETVLGWLALDERRLETAAEHLDVASDLAHAAGDARLLSCLHVLRAEVLVLQGRIPEAERELGLAAGTALRLADESAVEELRRRRAEVRRRLALPASGGR